MQLFMTGSVQQDQHSIISSTARQADPKHGTVEGVAWCARRQSRLGDDLGLCQATEDLNFALLTQYDSNELAECDTNLMQPPHCVRPNVGTDMPTVNQPTRPFFEKYMIHADYRPDFRGVAFRSNSYLRLWPRGERKAAIRSFASVIGSRSDRIHATSHGSGARVPLDTAWR